MHLSTETIGEFLLAGRQRGLAPATVATYRWHLERLAGDLAGPPTRAALLRWGAALHDHYSPATVRQATAAARALLTWLHATGRLAEDLAPCLALPRVPHRAQRTLSASELARLLAAAAALEEELTNVTAEQRTAISVRNAALLVTLFDTMLRAHELCALRLADLDLDGLVLTVRRGKCGASRWAFFSPPTADRLRAWLAVRPAVANDYLFVGVTGNTPGGPLTPSGLRCILRKLGARAGVKGVSPHAFRRGGAVALTRNGAPSRIVQVLGGWSTIQMVEVYTRVVEVEREGQAALARYSPVAAALRSNGDLNR